MAFGTNRYRTVIELTTGMEPYKNGFRASGIQIDRNGERTNEVRYVTSHDEWIMPFAMEDCTAEEIPLQPGDIVERYDEKRGTFTDASGVERPSYVTVLVKRVKLGSSKRDYDLL